MQNITLSADEHLIDQVRQIAQKQHTSLNQLFRNWLADLAAGQSSVREYEALMRDIRQSGVRVGRRFTREEMNER
jgi:hypothetical protein